MTEPIIAICRPIYQYTHPSTEHSLRFLQRPKPGTIHLLDTVGHEVSKARTMLVEEALKIPDLTHILFVDSDAVFLPDALMRLLAHDKPIVGALAFSRHLPYHPILGRMQPQWVERESPFGYIYHYPPDALFEIDATGFHFILIKTEVYRAIDAKFGDSVWFDSINGISEDFSFCQRARECGIPLYVDTGCKTGHIGEVTITEEIAQKLRPFEWEPWIPDLDEAVVAEGKPVASVVIPTYNQDPKYLRAAILSAAYQTAPTEVIVVDDGSEPAVQREKWWPRNARLIRQENKGVAGALNTGIRAMTTEWFCWLSSDDLFMPRKVEVQVAALRQGRMRASYHRYQCIGEGTWAMYTEIVKWRTIPEQMQTLAKVCAINGSTFMCHKSVFDDVGLFPEDMAYGQDYEFWCRVGEKYFIYPLDEILGSRREYAGNLTAAIEGDAEKKRLRDHEDEVIRARYAKWR